MGSERVVQVRVVLAASLVMASLWAGCIGAVDDYFAFDPDPKYRNPGVFIGNYSQSGSSLVLEAGPYKEGIPEVVHLRSTRLAYPEQVGLASSDGEVLIPMAIWRPEGVTHPVPIIVDAGPYYEIDQHCPQVGTSPGDCTVPLVNDTIDWPGQTTPFSLKNFLPWGYAVVQLAVRGTGTHGGCMDLMGDDEVHDLDQAISWLGSQPWSNGNIAIIGASYDGSTPWEVASTGNKHLKTIVPVAGLPDIYDLMFRNGSAETRGAIMHGTDTEITRPNEGQEGVYWGYGFSDGWMGVQPVGSPIPLPLPVPDVVPWDRLGNPFGGQANDREDYQNLQNLLCRDAYEGQAVARGSVATGGRMSEVSQYWLERDHRQAVLDNYDGSVFLIHGLQDWNVDPHAAIPFNTALRAKGLEMKEWYGQWGHAFPDSRCTAPVPEWATLPCRLDFAEVLFRWFERHLKGNLTVDVGPSVQVMDNVGQWRNAHSYPDANPGWMPLYLTADGALADKATGTPTSKRLMPSTNGAPAQIIELTSAPLQEDLHLSGMPQLDLPFQVLGEGGQIGVWMFDMDANGKVRAPTAIEFQNDWVPIGIPVVGHAQMNLLYYAGGEQRQTLVPGQTYTARIEFEPLEVLIPAGHHVVLWIFQYQYPDHLAATTKAPIDILIGGAGSVLRMPNVEVDAKNVFPVPGAHFPSRDLLDRMYIAKPVFPPQPPGVAAVASPSGFASNCSPPSASPLVALVAASSCRSG